MPEVSPCLQVNAVNNSHRVLYRCVNEVGVLLLLDGAIGLDFHVGWADGATNGVDALPACFQTGGQQKELFTLPGDFADIAAILSP